MTECDVN